MRANRLLPIVLQITLYGGLLALWEWAAQTDQLRKLILSAPNLILADLGRWMWSGALFRDTVVTLQEVTLGLVIGTILGLALGFALTRSQLVDQVFGPALLVLNAMPIILLVFPCIVLFGLGIWSKVFFAATLVTLFVLLATRLRLRKGDLNYVRNTQFVVAMEQESLPELRPTVLGLILPTLRTSFRLALTGAVFAEFFAAVRAGLGYHGWEAMRTFQMDGAFASVTVLTVIVIVFDLLVQIVEQYAYRRKSEMGRE